ncbi:ATP binding, partial [Rhizoctonia solani]
MSIEATPKPFRGPWEGDTKIVIGIDIGTTQSGVAFAFLENGASQAIHRAVAFGAEAQLHTIEEEAEDNDWVLARYFKLHLHPNDMQAKHELKLDDLPPGVSLRQIYSDFLRYLLKHTKAYFEDRIINGKNIWERHSPTMEVVIAHPNGWGVREQAFLRIAAVDAGFSSSNQAASKVRFVTEAEASVHFCIHHTNLGTVLRPGTNFAVCDAGGSTVDTTLYSVISAKPVLKLKEERASACVQAGAIFVDFETEKFLRKTLANARLSSDDVVEYTKAGVKDFEGFAKRAFKDDTTEQSIAVAHTRFNNSAIRARRGRITLPGSTVKGFFDVCVKEITRSVDQQINDLNVPYILLVGGFGDSPYIRSEFKKRYEPRGSRITLTNDSTSKAVADGAVIWSTLSSVSSRAPRYSFGVTVTVPFLTDIHRRQHRFPYTNARGEQVVSGGWSQIVQKGVALDSEVVCRRPYVRTYKTSNPDLELFNVDLLAYSSENTPEWGRDPYGNLAPGFQEACKIRANLRNLEGALVSATGKHGSRYWTLDFDVCIRFGGTELESYLEWSENVSIADLHK